MRNVWRLLAFDVLAPLAAILALLAIGLVLDWPWWWISGCSILVVLIVEAVGVNFWLLRRDAVTVGTDDDGPVLRVAVVLLCAGALVSAVVTGYTHWTRPDEAFDRDSRRVVQVATEMVEAMASFSPIDPTASRDRAAAMMVPDRAGGFKEQSAKSIADLTQRKVSVQAATLSAGVEALGPAAASVAVIVRVTETEPGQPVSRRAPALRVALTKRDDNWLVVDFAPINSR
jgi:hypothetical protein